ncbi:MAG: hypothetical protein JWO33_1117 [Caulobacteraceae bacterium]|nr:hypothetical protein [Caulobacteraceae bacterium]
MNMLRPVLLTVCAALIFVGQASAQPPPPVSPSPPVQVAPDPDAEPDEDPEEQSRDVVIPPPGTAPPVYAGDPKAYWTGPNRAPVQIDPLGDRRARKNQPKVAINNDVPPLLYRLWGLPPLQTMVLRPGEAVIEVWVRPTGASHEALARLTLRRDGKVFIQARAGMGCCRPDIARRIDIDQVVETKGVDYKALAKSPVWAQPRDVEVFRPDAVSPVCLKGAAFDLTLLEYDRSVHLRRICDGEAVGSVAPVLHEVLDAAMGKDPRFDALFRGGADFSFEQGQFERLLAEGGALRARAFKR